MAKTPNNVLHGRGIVPGLVWNDTEILARARTALGTNPPPGSTGHAEQIVKLFEHHKLAAPTRWAAIQWVRRRNIPDRWRAVLVYMLMSDKTLTASQLFRRAPTKTPDPVGTTT